MFATLLQLLGLVAVAVGLGWVFFPGGVLLGVGVVALAFGVAMERGDG